MIVVRWAWYVQMMSIYALRIVLKEVRWVYEEWWDGLAWIASLRRWIAPYAASSTTLHLHQALRITVAGKCGVVLIRGCCWVSKKVTSNNGRAEGGGGNTIYITT